MGNSKSILIVDDHPENLKVLSKILERENFRIRIAKNGIEAIKSVEAEIPSVILMDIQMPGIDGYETTRRIKSKGEFSSIPILFISALTETFDKIKAFEAGGQDYITKPFQEEEVVARVRTQFKMYEYQQILEDLNMDLYHQLQSSFEQAAIGIVHVDINTQKILKANKHFCDFTGYSQSELFIKTISDITHPNYVESDKDDLQKIASGEERIITKEKQYLCKNDVIKWGRVTFSLVKTLNEDIPDYLIAFVEDITEHKATEQKLKTTKSHYYEFIKTSSDAVTYWRMPKGLKTNLSIKDQLEMIFKGVCEDVNKSAWEHMGLSSKEQALGKKLKDLFDIQKQDIIDTFTKFISNKYSLENHSVHVITSQENDYYGLANWYGKIEDGALANIWTVSKDISELKAAEIELQKSEGQLQEAQKLAQLGNWELNLETNKLHWSDEIYEVFEIDKTKFDATYKAFLNAIHPDDRENVNQAYQKHLKDKKPYSIEHRVILSNGEIKYVHEQCKSVFDDKGKAILSKGIAQDITEIKKSENNFRESENRLKEAQTLAKLGNWELNIESNELYWSDEIFNIFEIDKNKFEATYEAFVETIHPEDREEVDTAYKNHLVNKKPYNIDHRLLMADGRIKYVHEQCDSSFNEKGEPIISVGTVQDITEKKLAEAELSKQSNRNQLIMDTMQDGYIYADQDGFIKDVNPAYCNMIGYSREELLKMNIREIEEKTALEEMERRIQQIVSMGRDHFETRHKRNDGKIIDIETNVNVVLIDERPMVATFVSDISVRKKAENEILKLNRELEERVEQRTKELVQEKQLTDSILDAIPGIFYAIDEESNYLKWNNNLLEILEITEKEIGQFTAENMIVPEDREKLFESIQKVYSEGSASVELNFLTKSKKTIPFLVTGEAFEESGKKYILGVGVDISNLKKAEKEIKKLSEAVVHSPSSVVITNPDGMIEYVNPKFTEISGYTYEEAIGKYGKILKSGVHSRDYYKQMWDTINSGAMWYGEFCNKKKNGEIYWENASISSIKDNEGKIIHFIGVKEDITQRKKMEEELKMAKELAEEATRTKSEFLANMSHEIRTPMNAVIGLSYLAMQNELNPKQYDYLFKIQSSGKALLGIINDILDFSKIEAGKLSLEKTDFDLEKVFSDVATVITYKAHEKGLEVVFNINEKVPLSLNGDPLRIGQIIINLANNAVKFTNEGEILIQVELENESNNDICLRFSVKDTGIGIKKDQINSLFESFTQADLNTTRKFGGTGLGLSICKNLVELMDGEIWAESQYGKGSTFIFDVKLKKQELQKQKALVPSVDLRKMKVLVCDDNLTSLEVLTSMLHSFTFKVKALTSGEEALTELERETSRPYELVILDWKMPGLDGLEVAERIKFNKNLSKIPTIIMVTAYTREQIIQRVDELQLSGLVTKPVSHSTLFDTIMEAFGKDVERKSFDLIIEAKYEEKLKERKGARILLVEDNDINQQVASEMIEAAGFVVEIAANGLEAINRLNKGTDFDLVFMDLQMPVMDGITASEKIRKNKDFDHIPIIAMTADVVGDIRERCLEIGMNEFIAKPISPESVFEAIIDWIKPGKRDVSKLKVKTQVTDGQKIEIPELEGINIDEGLNRVNGNKKLYQNLLLKFYDNNINLVEQLKKAYEMGNEETALRMVHTIKGVSGNIGANDLHLTTKELERKLKRKEYDDLNDLLDEYCLTLQPLLDTIEKYRHSLKPAIDKESVKKDEGSLDREQFKKLLEELKVMLENSDMDAAAKIEMILELPGLGDYKEQIMNIENELKKYDFEAAKNILNTSF